MSIKLSTALKYNLMIGLCDASTGVLLVFLPALTLGLMGIEKTPAEMVYLRFIGAFVFSVGASYWIPFTIAKDNTQELINSVITLWKTTALVRACVALLVLSQIISGELESAWLSVTATDGILCICQLMFIRNGILENQGKT